MPSLPLVAITPTPDGRGLLAQAVPQPQSPVFRTVDVPAEYLGIAAEAAATALNVLGERLHPEYGVRLQFVEPVGGPPEGTPMRGFAGFFSDDHPDRVFIVASWVPAAELAWIITHEIGHAAFFKELGRDGSDGPEDKGLSEHFADWFAEKLVGPSPLGHLRAGSGHPLRPAPGRVAIEGAITVTNAGATVIIDGTSNMFKIAATGTINVPSQAGTPICKATSVTLSTGLTYAPMIIGALAVSTAIYPVPRVDADLSTGGVMETDYLNDAVVNTNQTRVTATVCHDASAGSTPARTFRHYVLKEAAV